MKKTVTATITMEYEIEIHDEYLMQEMIAEFNKLFCLINNADDLFGHVAIQLAQFDEHFIEGLGAAKKEGSQAERVITFKEVSFNSDYEIN